MEFNLDEYTRQIIETVQKYDGNERFVLVANLIAEAHSKGKRYGHNKAVEICQNALKGMERVNSSSY